MSTFPNNPPLPTNAPSASLAGASSRVPEDPTSILGVAMFTEGVIPFATGPTASSTDPTTTSTTVVFAASTVPHDTVALVPDRISTTVNAIDEPPKPNMGGLVALSKTEWTAWTGNGTNLSLTGLGLIPTDCTYHVSPNQLCPALALSAQIAYNYHCTGLAKVHQYTITTGDLSAFQNAVWKHLQNSGMDTMSYLPDPKDPTKMTSVVTNHARFTLRTTKS